MSASSNGNHTRNATMASVLSETTVSPTASGFTQDDKEDMPGIYPPSHPYRTLVLCFDGTGDQFDADNSNIVQLFGALKKDDNEQQLVYYQAGIGTYTSPEIATPLRAKLSKTIDMAIGWYLSAHVMGGYEFLMQNYRANDRICIFGFSRGAYTARSLAGMINKVGILPACNHQQVPFAYKIFSQDNERGKYQAGLFKKTFSVDAQIEFVGVFDTVSSIGIISRTLPFTTSNNQIKTFRHALSLDEHRAKFRPAFAGHLVIESSPEHPQEDDNPSTHNHKYIYLPKHHPRNAHEQQYWKDPKENTNVEEVWFAGCHCDVGGGSVANYETTNLARIPLRWMIRECFKNNTGILFHGDILWELGLDPDALGPDYIRPLPVPVPSSAYIQPIPRPPKGCNFKRPPVPKRDSSKTEEELDLEDALSPKYDQLKLALPWWILEMWPLTYKCHVAKTDGKDQDVTNYRRRMLGLIGWKGKDQGDSKEKDQGNTKENLKTVTKWRINVGRGRKIPVQSDGAKLKVHRTVQMRTKAYVEDPKKNPKKKDLKKYHPKAKVDLNDVIWVD
ncbi:hypothetical protein BDP27DRAFT_1442309 [Rhodocollybia butyracea]|uniref:T6SS Phospholipase effector Tle1-like catalytic domain-containing protein n=1 Tax=Rhodocollybia butyracea TaxID=206335 RepID=A0A9P5UF63_9AGAR|nr:hypothetical protein BDP27DRAFT_1442309 [Rhodocollybia butyracea]